MWTYRERLNFYQKLRRSLYEILRDALEMRLTKISLIDSFYNHLKSGVEYSFPDKSELKPKSKKMEKESELYKTIAFEMVFRSPQLQQLDHKADYILTRLFEVYWENYVGGGGRAWGLLPVAREAAIREAGDEAAKARLVCDHVAAMTDGLATRTYKRLFDSDFGSIKPLRMKSSCILMALKGVLRS